MPQYSIQRGTPGPRQKEKNSVDGKLLTRAVQPQDSSRSHRVKSTSRRPPTARALLRGTRAHTQTQTRSRPSRARLGQGWAGPGLGRAGPGVGPARVGSARCSPACCAGHLRTGLPRRTLPLPCHLTLQHLGGRGHRVQPDLPPLSTGLAQKENKGMKGSTPPSRKNKLNISILGLAKKVRLYLNKDILKQTTNFERSEQF